MKRKLGIALVLAFLMVFAAGGTALAWDNEDSLVAANEDFVVSGGFDEGSWEFTAGAQYWPPGVTVPNDGYNLYRDDVTDTGNFDTGYVWTFTPDVVDLPTTASYGPYPDEGIAEYFIMQDESPDTYYWATGARGTDNPSLTESRPALRYLHIYLPDGDALFRWHANYLRDGAVDFCDGTWRIQIPAETQIEKDNGACIRKLFVDENGQITNTDIYFVYSQPGVEVTITPCLQ